VNELGDICRRFYKFSFEIRNPVKSRRRQLEWTEDEDNALYFAWNDQNLLEEALYVKTGKQPFEEFWQQLHDRFKSNTSGEGRSLASLLNRWHILVVRSNVGV
jgi:hypothetical protein